MQRPALCCITVRNEKFIDSNTPHHTVAVFGRYLILFALHNHQKHYLNHTFWIWFGVLADLDWSFVTVAEGLAFTQYPPKYRRLRLGHARCPISRLVYFVQSVKGLSLGFLRIPLHAQMQQVLMFRTWRSISSSFFKISEEQRKFE